MPFCLVTAIDFAEMTNHVIAAAAHQAESHSGAQVHAVCVIDPSHNMLGRDLDYSEELNELEKTLAARIRPRIAQAEVHARLGKPAEEVAHVAESVKADLIVLGRHSAGKRHRFLGSVPTRLLHLAHCDVLIVHPADYPAD